eukprot:TRINITY_DN66825_c0_g1_i1.p1 TRINITY_DN66825_c0_g1~~TRINITY_DN66825_c0_g1_i1.p1  ORF type:complete len:291 (-),score=67.11 TRINITY_DN66825_c0_g1_i1:12-884(-)
MSFANFAPVPIVNGGGRLLAKPVPASSQGTYNSESRCSAELGALERVLLLHSNKPNPHSRIPQGIYESDLSFNGNRMAPNPCYPGLADSDFVLNGNGMAPNICPPPGLVQSETGLCTEPLISDQDSHERFETVIIKGLHVSTTEAQIWDMLAVLGFPEEVVNFTNMPTRKSKTKSGSDQGRKSNRGFCFVSFFLPEVAADFMQRAAGYQFQTPSGTKDVTVEKSHVQVEGAQFSFSPGLPVSRFSVPFSTARAAHEASGLGAAAQVAGTFSPSGPAPEAPEQQILAILSL